MHKGAARTRIGDTADLPAMSFPEEVVQRCDLGVETFIRIMREKRALADFKIQEKKGQRN
jgi:hypothetical protein